MNYSTIKWVDVANGSGVRISLFVSGCHHRCPGCFNEETWDFEAGSPYTPEVEEKILTKLAPYYIKGLSLLGGEPMAPENQKTVLQLVKKVRQQYPEKDIWCYSGYRWEDLVAGNIGEDSQELVGHLDFLVDGLFVEGLKHPSLAFRGSANQRIIDVSASLAQKETVVREDESFR